MVPPTDAPQSCSFAHEVWSWLRRKLYQQKAAVRFPGSVIPPLHHWWKPPPPTPRPPGTSPKCCWVSEHNPTWRLNGPRTTSKFTRLSRVWINANPTPTLTVLVLKPKRRDLPTGQLTFLWSTWPGGNKALERSATFCRRPRRWSQAGLFLVQPLGDLKCFQSSNLLQVSVSLHRLGQLRLQSAHTQTLLLENGENIQTEEFGGEQQEVRRWRQEIPAKSC